MYEKEQKLLQAVINGNLDQVQHYVNAGAQIKMGVRNGIDGNLLGGTFLHSSSSKEVTSYLLQKGASPNSQAEDGMTPLHCAADENDAAVVDLLLKNHANPNLKDYNGKTPLHLTWNIQVTCLLLEAGANPNLKDEDGYTALDSAVKTNDTKRAELLRKYMKSAHDHQEYTSPGLSR